MTQILERKNMFPVFNTVFLIFSVLLLLSLLGFLTFSSTEDHHCIWRGNAYHDGMFWKNKPYDGPALPIDPSSNEVFQRRCPEFFKRNVNESGSKFFVAFLNK